MYRSVARPATAAALLLVAVAAGVLAGCGRSSMVGRRVDDFSAYYNKFYNARKAFAEATDGLDELDDAIDLSTPLPVFVEPKRAQDTEAFAKTIEKSADLLRAHPESKWVDDALLLIGKSYFYQENYVGAEQKFREVAQGGGPLAGEARFWTGRALLSAGDLAAAEQHLRQALSGSEDSATRWTAQARLLQGDLLVRQGRWGEAADALAEGVRDVRDGQVRARAFFLRGQALETAGYYGEAARSYQSALEERPRYELAYAAEASALRTAVRSSQGGAILSRLERMERDDKNESKRAELSLLRGQLYQAQRRPDVARRHYRELLYPGEGGRRGAAAPSGAVSGRAHYALATLYRDAYSDFTRAAAHFDTASTALARGNREERRGAPPTAYAVTDSRRQAERYGRVAEASTVVARLDSLMRLGRMEPDAFAAFVDSVEGARTAAARAAEEEQARRRVEQRFGGGSAAGPSGARGGSAPLAGRGAGGASDAGFLFYGDPAQVQQGRRAFRRRWGERPRVANWRRRAAISTQAENEAPGDPSGPIGPDEDVEALPRPSLDVSEVPRSPERLQQMRAERAVARYNLGNALLLAAERPDSAAVWFRRVINRNAGEEVAHRARYALAEAERAAGRDEAAREQYRRVVREQRGTRRARRAEQRLGEERTASAASPAAERAEQAYAAAYQVWQDGDRRSAIGQMLRAATAYPASATAPRALLAAARIFAEWARRTGQPVQTTPLPVRPSDSLRALLFDSTATAASPDRPVASPGLATPDSAVSVLAVPDSAFSRPTVAGPATPDSIITDSASSDSAAADSAAPGPVSAAPPISLLTLGRLLEGLARRYPETPHAERARRMAAVLSASSSEAPPEALPDTVPSGSPPASPDSTLRDSGIVVTRRGQRPAETTLDSASASSRAAPPGSVAAEGSASEDDGDTWAIVVASGRRRSEADSLAARQRARRADTVAVRVLPAARERYRVTVGAFPTRATAGAARRRGDWPPGSRVLPVPRPE